MISEKCALGESEQWSAYVDRNLPAADLARAEEHLAGCEECRGTVKAIASIKRRAYVAQVAPPTAVLASIKHEMHHRQFPWIRAGFALLAASVLLAFGLLRRQNNSNGSPISTVDVAATQSLRRTLTTLDDAIMTTQAELARNPDDTLLTQLLRDAQADKSRALFSARELARRSQ